MKKSILALTAACAFLLVPIAHAQQHSHFNAGVIDLNGNNRGDTGEQLALTNFPSSGLIVHMVLNVVGAEYGGYYSLDQRARALYPNDYFTFTALSDGQYDAPGDDHAKTGTFVQMLITSVAGPAGSSFGFWEGENLDINSGLAWSKNHTTPYKSFSSNLAFTPFAFDLTEGYPGDLTLDPLGHIHNRGWSATMEGVYTVGFQLIDANNIQTPSQTYYITFLAGNAVIPEPQTVTLLIGGALVGGVAWYRSRRKAGQS
jgi:hypothetical protein